MHRQITHGSLFSGIGGAELAAEWNGVKNLFHCDINGFGRSVLDYWYPESESYGDITTTDFSKWEGRIDILSGGFPCQPFSTAGLRKGAGDNRYLWPQMLRVIGEVKPNYIVGENVAGLLSMVEFEGTAPRMEEQDNLFGTRREEVRHGRYTLERICGELEAAGYSVQPLIVPACAVNAPHRRDRIWFLAKRKSVPATEDTIGDGRDGNEWQSRAQGGEQRDAGARDDERVLRATADAVSEKRGASEHRVAGANTMEHEEQRKVSQEPDRCATAGKALHADSEYVQRRSDTEECKSARLMSYEPDARPMRPRGFEDFPTQPPLCLGDDGLPFGVADAPVYGEPRHGRRRWKNEALKALGNAWVPQVAAEIFAAIVQDIREDEQTVRK